MPKHTLIGCQDQACCWAVSMEITIASSPHPDRERARERWEVETNDDNEKRVIRFGNKGETEMEGSVCVSVKQ